MLYGIGLFLTAVFAITGALAAEKKDMDLFSVVILGLVTALGGGTIRDVIVGHSPVFWATDVNYLWVSLIAVIIFFFVVRIYRLPQKLLLIADAAGVALFNIQAINMTLNYGFAVSVAITMGITTGIAGGIIRDLLCHEKPLMLRRELYATPLLFGGLLFVVLRHYNVNSDITFWVGVLSAFFFRLAAIQYNFSYPHFLVYQTRPRP